MAAVACKCLRNGFGSLSHELMESETGFERMCSMYRIPVWSFPEHWLPNSTVRVQLEQHIMGIDFSSFTAICHSSAFLTILSWCLCLPTHTERKEVVPLPVRKLVQDKEVTRILSRNLPFFNFRKKTRNFRLDYSKNIWRWFPDFSMPCGNSLWICFVFTFILFFLLCWCC